MERLMQSLRMGINEKLYLKDPESSTLGKKIIEESILMINEMGFENFNFKKLGSKIGSNESSIYRYFENKHKLLLYLASWYWRWMEYKMVLATHSIPDCFEKLQKAVEILTQNVEEDIDFSHVNEVILNKIVINEYSKSYVTKNVEKENKEGYFAIYKRLVYRLEEMIATHNPEYPYSLSLASTILEGSLHQHFLREHFPGLTNCNQDVEPVHFFMDLITRSLKSKANG
ncbi:TetR/AcrR family transcriptional regulator [Allomuricauda taeanensis]|uniref:TetR/AcrR family transcriptional regulator n=1 Tax=Flagellimonas taeanensis TaxID=1005926 RepID=UPI002E7BD991|nr:TetR/AcrR family transcriptional regulator [Allomuricauda taeanensis]MEE1963658.1 TetR/AcrR family transcriptional regulator [Allomuricauda taeanensis]